MLFKISHLARANVGQELKPVRAQQIFWKTFFEAFHSHLLTITIRHNWQDHPFGIILPSEHGIHRIGHIGIIIKTSIFVSWHAVGCLRSLPIVVGCLAIVGPAWMVSAKSVDILRGTLEKKYILDRLG